MKLVRKIEVTNIKNIHDPKVYLLIIKLTELSNYSPTQPSWTNLLSELCCTKMCQIMCRDDRPNSMYEDQHCYEVQGWVNVVMKTSIIE